MEFKVQPIRLIGTTFNSIVNDLQEARARERVFLEELDSMAIEECICVTICDHCTHESVKTPKDAGCLAHSKKNQKAADRREHLESEISETKEKILGLERGIRIFSKTKITIAAAPDNYNPIIPMSMTDLNFNDSSLNINTRRPDDIFFSDLSTDEVIGGLSIDDYQFMTLVSSEGKLVTIKKIDENFIKIEAV